MTVVNAQLPGMYLPEAICIICQKGLCRLPQGIVSFARSETCHLPEGMKKCVVCPKGLCHLPEGICITCPIEFTASRGILSNRDFKRYVVTIKRKNNSKDLSYNFCFSEKNDFYLKKNQFLMCQRFRICFNIVSLAQYSLPHRADTVISSSLKIRCYSKIKK